MFTKAHALVLQRDVHRAFVHTYSSKQTLFAINPILLREAKTCKNKIKMTWFLGLQAQQYKQLVVKCVRFTDKVTSVHFTTLWSCVHIIEHTEYEQGSKEDLVK